MFTPNNAKDLVALACVAFQSKDFAGAGSLFAQAMSLHDSDSFVDSLLVGNFTCAALASSIDDAENTDDPEGLASIASTLSFNMSTSFREDLKASLLEDTEFDDLSVSDCSKQHSLSDDSDDDADLDDEFEDDDLSDADDDLESESAVLFKPVTSPLSLT